MIINRPPHEAGNSRGGRGMRLKPFQPRRTHERRKAVRGLQAALLTSSLLAAPWLFAAGTNQPSHDGHATPVAMPGWTQDLKGQTVVEDAIEGRADRSEKIEIQHHRLMRRLEEQAQAGRAGADTSGAFNDMSMMHQYMGQDGSSFLLATRGKGEPAGTAGQVSVRGPDQHYDISMINVEITLNRWLDYYPGYMYVLTQDMDKVRAEEAKNKAAREKDGFDPGAVTTGLQGDMIQPLVIRANQGDCVKMTLRNQMESEDGSCSYQAAAWWSARRGSLPQRPIPKRLCHQVRRRRLNGTSILPCRKACGSFTPIAMTAN